MSEVVPWVLGAWVIGTLGLFAVRPGRDAALISVLAGWAFLPVMVYPAWAFREAIGTAGSAQAVTVAGGPLMNKAAVIGLGCLAGMVAFDWGALRRVRWGWVDVPMLVWCVVPMASAFSNGLHASAGLAMVRDQALAWGAPYLVGRAYLGDGEGLRALGLGLVASGLAYVLPCVLEFIAAPSLYGLAYGPHPYQMEGAPRWVGWRPLVFLEHGNQLGIWVATTALAAVWLWKTAPERSSVKVPWWVALGLCLLALVCQSHGAIVLGAAGLAPLAWVKDRGDYSRDALRAARPWTGVLVVVGILVGLVAAGLAARDPAIRGKVRSVFSGIGKTSFTWRLARSEEALSRVAERPILGTADRDWIGGTTGPPLNPVNVGYGIIALGAYGLIGLGAWGTAMIAPVVSTLRRFPARGRPSPDLPPLTLAVALMAMNLGDALFNSTWLMPMTCVAGGLTTWAARNR